jgi:outer membrane protein assembly factor BamB
MLLLRDSPPGDGTAAQDNALGVIVAVNLQNGQVLWRHSLDLPSPQAVEVGEPLQPLLQGGIVLVPENYANQHGDHAFGELVALDPATGQERWTHTIAPANTDLVTELDSEPVEANGVVYLTANVLSTSAPLPPPQDQSLPTLLVQAVNSHTGSLLWSRTLSGFDSSPDVADGYVILLGNRRLMALRTTDGSLAWTFTPAGPYPYTAVDDGGPANEAYAVGDGYPGPVIVDHLVLVDAVAIGAGGQGLGATWFAVSTSTGKLVWQSARSVLGGGYTRPVLNQSGDVLCTSGTSVAASSYVLGLAAATGDTLWNHSTPSELSMCAASGDTFYLSERNVQGTSGGLLAFDSRSGMPLWQTATARPGGSSDVAAPPQDDGLAAIAAEGPTSAGTYLLTNPVVVIQLSTGKVMWQQDLFLIDPARPMIVVDHEVLIPVDSQTSGSVQLVAYSLQAGSWNWTLQLVSRQ